MHIYLVIFNDANGADKSEAYRANKKRAVEKLEKDYPDHYHYPAGEEVYLIRSEKLSEQIAENLGMGREENIAGVVLRLNGGYWGLTSVSFWEWLQKNDDF